MSDQSKMIKATIVYNPLDTTDRQDAELLFEKGKSISHYMNGLPKHVEWAVALNGVAIPSAGLAFTFPKPNDHLVVIPVPEGGGGGSGGGDGKAILALVATVALNIFAPGIGTALSGALNLGAFGAKMLTAAVSIAGGILINSLIPAADEGASESTSYGIDGAKNTSTEGVAFPVLYGEHAFGGNFIDLYTENSTDEDGKAIQYLYARTLASEGPIDSIGQVYLDDQVIENYDDVEVDYRLGHDSQTVSPWFNETIGLFNQAKTLSTDWQTYTTSEEVDKLRVDITAPSGVSRYDSKGRLDTITIEMELEYSKTGEDDWSKIYGEAIWHSSENVTDVANAIRIAATVKNFTAFDRGDDGTRTYTVVLSYREIGATAWIAAGTKSGTVRGSSSVDESVIVTGLSTAVYESKAVVSASSGGSNVSATATTQHKFGGPVKIKDDTSDVVRRTYKSELLEEAVYDVRFRRMTDETDGHNDTVIVSDIGEIKVEPLSLPFTAWLGVKIKLTDQLSGIPAITAVGKGRVVNIYDHNGEITDFRYSNNPADVALDAYTHTRYGGQIEEERLDFAAFSEWRDFCTENDYTFNGLFYDTSNLDDSLKHVFIAGRAQRVSSGAKLSVAIDRVDTPTMMFSDGNVKTGSMNITYLPFADRINDLEIAFNDKEDQYKRSVVRVTNDAALNKGEPLKSTTIELKGITDQERALREGTLRMNYNRLVKRTASWESPAEALSCAVGDVVIVQHKMPGWGKGGRLLPASTVSQVKLDQEVDIEPGKDYRVLVHQNKKVHATGVSVMSQTGNLITINTPVQSGWGLSLIKSTALGEELGVTRVIDSTTLLLDKSADDIDLTSVVDLQLIETDYIADVEVTNNAVSTTITTDVLDLETDLVSAPDQYPNFIFGEIQYTKKPFRIKTITRSSDVNMGITAIEYVEEVYSDDPEAQTHNYSSLIIAGQAINVSVEELIKQQNGQNVSKAVVRWEPATSGIYTGARVQSSINGLPFETLVVSTGTRFEFVVNKGDSVRVRVLPMVYGTDRTVTVALATVVSMVVQGVTIASAPPVNWIGASGVRSITLTGPVSSDLNTFDHFNFYVGESGDTFATATYLGRSDANIFTYTVTSTGKRYWITEIDTDGNESGPSNRVDVDPSRVMSVEISDGAITSAQIDNTIAGTIASPTGLSITSQIQNDGYSKVSVTWSAISNAVSYEVAVSQDGGNEVVTSVGSNILEFNVPPSTPVTARVRSLNGISEKSIYSATASHNAAIDTIAPAKPTGVLSTSGFGSAWIEWNANTEIDMSHYELFEATTTAGYPVAASDATYSSTTNEFSRSGLGYDATRYYWVRSVDTSGNKSFWSNRVSVVTPSQEAVTVADIAGIVDATSFAAGMTGVETFDALPISGNFESRTGVLSTDGKLYRYTSGAWTKAVSTGDLTGSITSTQITSLDTAKLAGQIASAQITSVSSTKLTGTINEARIAGLAASKVTGQLTNDQIASVEAAKVAGTLTNTQLAGISSSKLIGSIVSSQIASVSATSLTGTINEARIAGLAASKVTGTMSDSQIAAVSAAKLVGQVVSGQISSVAATKLTGTIASARISGIAASKVTGALTSSQISSIDAAKVSGTLTNAQIDSVAAGKLTGTVVASQIAANAISIGKLANGLQPLEIVATLPTSGSYEGRSVFLTTNGKIYRRHSGAWTVGVATTDLSGQIANTQIASISAIKMTGTLSDSQIAAVSAAKVSGQLTNTQIASIASTKMTGTITNAQIGSVAASKMTGTLANAQISSLAASKVTGTLTNAQIAAVDATKVSGQLTSAQIASIASTKMTGVITNTQIGTNSVTTAKIATNAVTASEIATNTITAGQIAANAITTSELSANAVTAGHIVAGTITASEIATNAITSTKIEAGAITTAKIAAGSVTAGEIAAGTIVADNMASNSITAGKIAIGDFTNLNIDRDYVDEDAWAGASSFYVTNISDWRSSRVMRITGAANTYQPVYSRPFQVTEGDELLVTLTSQIDTEVSAGGEVSLNLQFSTHETGPFDTNVWPSPAVGGDHNTIQTKAGSLVVPADKKWARIRPYKQDGPATDVRFGAIDVRVKATGELIVDGTITANNIATNAITAGKIAAGTIVAADIAANTITATNLGANSVNASHVVANAITASELAANAVTAAKISAGAITADKIAANTITAGKIASNAITTSELAANAVTAAHIVAGTITASEIASNAITSAKITANAITAGKISAGIISASHVAAGTMTARELSVGDFSNLISGADFENPLDMGWNVADSLGVMKTGYFLASTHHSGTKGLRLSSTAGSVNANASPVSVSEGEKLHVEFWAFRDSSYNGDGQNKLRFADADTGSHITSLAFPVSAIPSHSTWTKLSREVTAPAGVRSITIQIVTNNSHTTGYIYLDDMVIRRKNGGELIVDGAITSTKVAADAINASHIVAGTITAAEISAGAITATTLGANSVNASHVVANAITASELSANAVTAAKISAGAIVAGKIAVGAIQASDIAAGAITTAKLSVGGGGNLLVNTDFWGDAGDWDLSAGSGSGAQTTFRVREPGESWAGKYFPTFQIYQGGASTDGYVDLRNNPVYNEAGIRSIGVPVTAGENYEASVYISTHRCTGELRIQWKDANGDTISYAGTTAIGSITSSDDSPDEWPRAVVRGIAPTGAVKATIHLRKFGTLSNTSSHMFVHKPQLTQTVPNPSEVVPYTNGGFTMINGGQIVTNTILARHILAGTITASEIAAGAIVSNSLATNAVTAGKIIAGAITTAKIATNAITATQIAAGTIVADNMASNSITAGKLAIGDFTNLNIDRDYADEASWPGATSFYTPTYEGWRSSRVMQITGAANSYQPAYSRSFQVTTGDELLVTLTSQVAAQTTTGGQVALSLQFSDNADTGFVSDTWPSPSITGTSTSVVTKAGSLTVPVDKKWARIRVYKASGPATTVRIGAIDIRVKAKGSLIVDGTITAGKIAVNTITAGNISANAITTDELATNAVTAVKVSANAITATKISAGAITADKVAANAITAVKIQAGAITTAKITAGAVTATTIATGAITAGKIEADAINATHIAAGSITADNLGARVITAGKLAIGDFTNLNIDRDYADEASWPGATGFYTTTNSLWGSTRVLRITDGGGIYRPAYSRQFQVTAGEELLLTAATQVYAGAGTVAVNLVFSATETTGYSTNVWASPGVSGTHTSIATKEGSLTVPAGMRWAIIRVYKAGQGETEVRVGGISVRRKATGALIVDGAITADKVAANSITADQIESNAITTNELATNAVTADNITANAITTGAIASGAVNTAQLAAGAVTANKMLITDMTNIVPNGKWEDIDLESYFDISGAGDVRFLPKSQNVAYAETGEGCLLLQKDVAGANSINIVMKQLIPVVGGEDLYCEVSTRTNNAATSAGAYVRFRWYKHNGSPASTDYTDFLNNQPLSQSWVTKTNKYVVPSDAVTMQVQMYNHSSQTTITNMFVDRLIVRRMHKGELIVDGSIKADHVGTNELLAHSANIKDGVITTAKIGSAQITNAKIANATISSAKIATIDAAKITISGSTSLSDWRMGGDTTRIDGGKLSANTVSANAMYIGQRGIQVEGLKFSTAGNVLSWTTGSIRYVNDAGGYTLQVVGAGSTTYTTTPRYVYWTQGSSSLSSGTNPSSVLLGANIVSLAVYKGGSVLTTDYGRTVIEGDLIKTGTIQASHIAAGSITTAQLNTGDIEITGDMIVGGHLVKNYTSLQTAAYTLVTATSASYSTMGVEIRGMKLDNSVAHTSATGVGEANPVQIELSTTVLQGHADPMRALFKIQGRTEAGSWTDIPTYATLSQLCEGVSGEGYEYHVKLLFPAGDVYTYTRLRALRACYWPTTNSGVGSGLNTSLEVSQKTPV